jgi:hypothetical protein
MNKGRLIAYLLIAIGAISLLSRTGEANWLWMGSVAAAFIAAYASRKNYGFLVAGSVLAGVAVGMLFPTQAGKLLSLAVGFFVIDRVEPRPNRWPFYVAGILAALGLLSAFTSSGLFGSAGFGLLLVALGVFLLLRDRGALPARTTVVVPPPTAPTPGAPDSAAPSQAAPGTSAQAHPAPPPPSAPPTMGGESDPTTEAPSAELTAEPRAATLSPEARARLERLEAWRRETAAAEGTPAYIVLRNETLEQLAVHNPQTLAELGNVKGIGPVKLERYGEALLRVLRGDLPQPS